MAVPADIDHKDSGQKGLGQKAGDQQALEFATPARVFPSLIVLFGALFALVPYWGDDVGLRESFLLAAVYITLASNLNVMIGYAGYINFGNIVFFGLGGYVCVDLVTRWHWPLVPAALAGGATVSLLALVFGFGILRLRGAFFALATIGVNEAVRQFVANFEPWGGATGIDLTLSIEAIVMVMLGGYGTVAGPLLGAFLYEELRGYLLTSPTISQLQLVIAGALLLAMVLFAPGGLMGFIHQRWPRSRTILQ